MILDACRFVGGMLVANDFTVRDSSIEKVGNHDAKEHFPRAGNVNGNTDPHECLTVIPVDAKLVRLSVVAL